MSFNPAGTRWSVAGFNQDGTLGPFHPTAWVFNNPSMNAGTLWVGGYRALPNCDNGFACEILGEGSSSPSDSFEVYFVTKDRFVATKNGGLYRFGKLVG